MAGKPFKVGRFAHSLRVRLMREHLGIDVDALNDEDPRAYHPAEGQVTNVRDSQRGEQKAQRARHLLRKHPNVKVDQLPRTVPTHKPKYDADSFEDPLCDEFWVEIWAACAVHNVGVYRFLELEAITN